MFVQRYRRLFWLAGAALFGLGLWLMAGGKTSFGDVHVRLLERVHARGWQGDDLNLYAKCLVVERACSRWYWDQKGAPGLNHLFLVMGGLVVGVLPFGFRGKQKPYSGMFAGLKELLDICHKSWASKRLHYALLVGFHLPLPDLEPARGEVIRGHQLRGASKHILAVSQGYGGRQEIGHLAAFGATRSGKSVHLMSQAVIWRGSFICLDIKGELYSETAGLRAETGTVYCISAEGGGHRFDALSQLLKTKDGDHTAGLIITEPHKQDNPVFAERAALGLAAVFRAAQLQGLPPLAYAREIIVDGGLSTFFTRIAEFDDPEVRRRANGFVGMGGDAAAKLEDKLSAAFQNKFLTSAWDVMSLKLNAFLSESIAWIFSGNDFQPADLMRQPTSVYLQFPEATLEATTPVYNMLITGLMVGMTRYVDESRKLYGNRWNPPVPVLAGLDEVKRAPISNLDGLLSTAAGRGITVMLYLQSPSQFDDLYGKAATESILNNCGVQLYYKTESVATAEYIQKRCHNISVESSSTSRTINRWLMPVSRSEGTTPREVFTVEEALALGGENRQVILAFVSGKRPFLAKRMNYYEHGLGKLMGLYPAPPIPKMALPDAAGATTPDAPPRSAKPPPPPMQA